jgi:hypothetical protein
MAKSAATKIMVGLNEALEHAKTNTIFKIEKNVPVPIWMTGKYPLGDMEIGDSFSIPDPDIVELRRVRAAACAFGKRVERLYSVRKDPKKPGSYRCWRVE